MFLESKGIITACKKSVKSTPYPHSRTAVYMCKHVNGMFLDIIQPFVKVIKNCRVVVVTVSETPSSPEYCEKVLVFKYHLMLDGSGIKAIPRSIPVSDSGSLDK